jgi:hypothetical protein
MVGCVAAGYWIVLFNQILAVAKTNAYRKMNVSVSRAVKAVCKRDEVPSIPEDVVRERVDEPGSDTFWHN